MPRINPLTRKRLLRFVHHRRAFVSFVLLACIYAITLAAELLCNGKPLAVLCGGHVYFPFVKYYAEGAFLGNGVGTAPDYRTLERTAAEKGLGCHILWAPFRHGPNDIIGEGELASSLRMQVGLEPAIRTAVLTIDGTGRIMKTQNAKAFGNAAELPATLKEMWVLPPNADEAIAARFNNRASPAMKASLHGKAGMPEAEMSLAAYAPRAAAPKSLRVTVRIAGGNVTSGKWTLDGKGLPNAIASLGGDVEKIVRELAKEATSTGGISSREIETGQGSCVLSVEREIVHFPFRPVAGHWLGIDDAGRDVLARLVYAVRTSITFGLVLVLSSMIVGTMVGLGQGYFGGWTDLACQRLIEIWSALPFLYVIILLGSIYGPGFMLLIFCNAIFNWIGISYYMRAEMLRLKRQPFVEAARCLGLPARRIIFRHILPNGLVPIITFFPFSLVGAIGSLAALDYLGFGLPLQSPSIGQLLQQAQNQRWAWWLILYPSLCLFTLMLLGVFIGEGVRDAMDPKR